MNDLDQAKADLAALKAERDGLPAALRAAAEAADAETLLTLRRRADDLPLATHAAEVRLERLEIAALEARLPGLEAAWHDAGAESERLWKLAHAAREQAERAFGAAGNAESAYRGLTINIATRKRALADKVQRHAAPVAPVVRSLWQGY